MQLDPRHKIISFWKQDVVALLLVVIYIALAIVAMWAWNLLSAEADAFVSKAERADVGQVEASADAQ